MSDRRERGRLQRRDFLRLIGGGALAASGSGLLAGCGGNILGNGGGNNNGGGDNNGGNNGGGTVTPQQRAATLQETAAKREEISATTTDPQAQNNALAAYLRTRSEFEAVGLDDTLSVWARFKDGQMVVYSNNRPPETGPQVTQPALTRGGRATGQVPRDQQAYLVHAFSLGFPVGQAVINDLSGWLRDKGYVIETSAEGNADIRRLALVGGDGVFYFNTHAGAGTDRQGTRHYLLWSSTKWTLERDQDPVIQEELRTGRVVRMNCETGEEKNGKRVTEYHYSITSRFVDQYWDFSGNAFVWLNACFSMKNHPEILAFRDACIRKGAQAVVGWTHLMTPTEGYRATRFVFDRLLGANSNTPTDPKQRPFDLTPVMAELQKRGWHKDSGTGAELLVYPTSGNALLTPTIKFMDVNEEESELILYGEFGLDPGGSLREVTIAGVMTAVKSWSSTEIRCVLPVSGVGSAGDVQVEVRGRKSNLRRLTEWRGRMTYTLDHVMSLELKLYLDVHFRADLQQYRDIPDEAPKNRNPVPFESARDGVTQYHASGTATNGDTTAWWTGDGALPYATWDDPVLLTPHARLRGTFDPAGKKVTLAIDIGHPGGTSGWKHTSSGKGGTGSVYLPIFIAPTIFDRIVQPTPTNTLSGLVLDLRLDANYGIVGDRRQKLIPNQTGIGDDPIPATLEWSTIAANFPPDPTGTRGR